MKDWYSIIKEQEMINFHTDVWSKSINKYNNYFYGTQFKICVIGIDFVNLIY